MSYDKLDTRNDTEETADDIKKFERVHHSSLERVKELRSETKISAEGLLNTWLKTIDLTSKTIESNIHEFIDLLRSEMEMMSADQKKFANTLADKLSDALTASYSTVGSSMQDYYETFANHLKNSVLQVATLTEDYEESMKQTGTILEDTSKSIFQKPSELVFKYQEEIKKQMKAVGSLQQDMLNESLEERRSEFANKITDDIDLIHEGMLKTKNVMNDTITDTVNYIKQSLMKVNERMDRDFGKKVGKLQNTIHDYESGIIEAFNSAATSYETQVTKIVEVQGKLFTENTANLTKELESVKSEIEGKVQTMQSETANSINSKLNTLTKNFKASRDLVTKSYNELKNLLLSSKTSHLEILKETVLSSSQSITERADEFIEKANKTKEKELKDLNKVSLKTIGNVSKSIKGNIMEVEKDLSEVERELEELLKGVIKQDKTEIDK